MDTTAILILIFMLAAISFATRASFIVLFARAALPPGVESALRYVPAALLSALVFPDVFLASGSLQLGPGNPKLLAAILAGTVAWKTRNTLMAIVLGMAALHLVRVAYAGTPP